MYGSAFIDPVKLTRDCEVVQIPEGLKVKLARGTEVRIMQSLGGSFTVVTDRGHMVRISGKDADAIGQPVENEPQFQSGEQSDPSAIEEHVWSQLRGVYDPEIPVNVVDLGLVYQCEVKPLEGGGFRVQVQMTLTAPGCGMGGVLKVDAEDRIRAIPGVKEAVVEIVVDPPWDQSRMSEAARLQLGFL